MKLRLWTIIGLLAILMSSTGCVGCTRIGAGRVGIKIKLAGTDRGVQDTPAVTGWLFYNIFTEQIFEYPTSVQNANTTRHDDWLVHCRLRRPGCDASLRG